jgi:hypothetical protein
MSALKGPPFLLFNTGAFFSFIRIYIPFFYVSPFTLQKIPGITAEFAVYTIAIMDVALTISRIVPNYVANKTGPLNLITPCVLISAVLVYS